jgi:tRNA (guanine-N7-)-methyltransferase
MHFLNKIYYKFFKKLSIKTVHLRGRLSKEEEEIFAQARGSGLVEAVVVGDKKLILEIGFGNGQHLVGLAQRNSEAQVYGVELYKAGIVKVLKEMNQKKLQNLKVLCKDAREVLDDLKDKSVSEMYILFPDPWPKVRHHKRRLLQKDFIKQCVKILSDGGVLYIATDWENYAEEIEKYLMELSESKVLKYSKLLESPVVDKIKETTFAKRAEKEDRESVVFQINK